MSYILYALFALIKNMFRRRLYYYQFLLNKIPEKSPKNFHFCFLGYNICNSKNLKISDNKAIFKHFIIIRKYQKIRLNSSARLHHILKNRFK